MQSCLFPVVDQYREVVTRGFPPSCPGCSTERHAWLHTVPLSAATSSFTHTRGFLVVAVYAAVKSPASHLERCCLTRRRTCPAYLHYETDWVRVTTQQQIWPRCVEARTACRGSTGKSCLRNISIPSFIPQPDSSLRSTGRRQHRKMMHSPHHAARSSKQLQQYVQSDG